MQRRTQGPHGSESDGLTGAKFQPYHSTPMLLEMMRRSFLLTLCCKERPGSRETAIIKERKRFCTQKVLKVRACEACLNIVDACLMTLH